MKFKLIILLAAFGLGFISSYAQTTTTKTPEQRADYHAKKLTKVLSLNADQTSKVREAALTKAQKVDALRAKNLTDKKAHHAERKAIGAEFESQLKTFLTPDQFQLFLTRKEEMKKKHQQKKASSSTKSMLDDGDDDMY